MKVRDLLPQNIIPKQAYIYFVTVLPIRILSARTKCPVNTKLVQTYLYIGQMPISYKVIIVLHKSIIAC